MFDKESTFLVVDDSMTIRVTVQNLLKELGFTRVTLVEDGAIAFEKLKTMQTMQSLPALIISDWNMPEVTGIEFLKKVRSTPPFTKIPFLLLTAEAEKTQVVEAIQAGVNGYLKKPFTLQDLTDAVNLPRRKRRGITGARSTLRTPSVYEGKEAFQASLQPPGKGDLYPAPQAAGSYVTLIKKL